MKSVLISIQPKWCELIASGKKTIEVRKTRPKLETPFKVYIYCTKSTDRLLYFSCNDKVLRTTKRKYIHSIERTCKIFSGKVIGEFVCDRIEDFSKVSYDDLDALYLHIKLSGCIFEDEFNFFTAECGYGWHISNLKIYDKPKELGEFNSICPYRNPDGTRMNNVPCPCDKYTWGFDEKIGKAYCMRRMTRPPQSWCYVEETQDERI